MSSHALERAIVALVLHSSSSRENPYRDTYLIEKLCKEGYKESEIVLALQSLISRGLLASERREEWSESEPSLTEQIMGPAAFAEVMGPAFAAPPPMKIGGYLAIWPLPASASVLSGGIKSTKKALDTTPDCQEPPEAEIRAAQRDIPRVLNNMTNAQGLVYEKPGLGHKAVLASRLVANLQKKSHARDAAHWAVHRSICDGLLHAEIPETGLPTVGNEPEHLARPVFHGSVPYDHLLIRSTDDLWAWWRGLQSEAPPDSPARPEVPQTKELPPNLDPSHCPGCKSPVPDEYKTLGKVPCLNCSRWELHTGLLTVPVAGIAGTPPKIVRMHSPYWRPLLPPTPPDPEESRDKPPRGKVAGARLRKGGKKRLEESNPLKFNIYQRIHREHQPGADYAATVSQLKSDKDFVEQILQAKLKLNTKLVNNALAFFDQRRREGAAKKQETGSD